MTSDQPPDPPETEPVQPQSAPEAAAPSKKRRRVGLVAAITAGGLVVVGAAIWLLTLATYGGAFERLFAATETAETAPVWIDFFVAQDCFVSAVLDVGDPHLAYRGAITLRDQTGALTSHVKASLDIFAGLTPSSFHGRLRPAHTAIVAHYQAWDDHLVEAAEVMSEVPEEPLGLANLFQNLAQAIVKANDPIETTYNDAKAAFAEAAPNDATRDDVDRLFQPSEARCTSGAV
jgi:hypothetical protein